MLHHPKWSQRAIKGRNGEFLYFPEAEREEKYLILSECHAYADKQESLGSDPSKRSSKVHALLHYRSPEFLVHQGGDGGGAGGADGKRCDAAGFT